MYFLFRFHHKLPGEVYQLPQNEKQITLAFMRYELEQRIREQEQAKEA